METVHFIFLVLSFLICKCYSQNYDKENLKKLTEYRQQHRKTVDGRLCAAAFVQDDQTYTDCTKATDPNGITGKDWCYVEVQLIGKGNRDWDYCKGVINYDVVRSKARTFFQAKSNELSSAVTKLDVEHKKLGGIYEKYQEICGATSELLKKKIQEINDIAKISSRNINKLLLQASSISDTETKMYELEDEVDKNRKAFLENKKNCSVLKGYAVEDRADGLIGSYYDNAYFSGYPVSINTDKYINYIWDTGIPIENIPYQHFSVRWDGYLKIPQTGNYIITIEHDCGVRIFLDNSPIIVSNMPYPKEDESEEMKPISVLPIEKINAKVHKISSEKLGLIGGKKYKFRIEYFHLSSIKYENPDNAHIIIYWKSDNIVEEIIPTNYFFQGNVTSPLRISELRGNEYEIIFLENGVYAFMNSLDFIVTDIPTIYERSKAIRTLSDPNKNTIRFRINAYSTAYIAIPKEEKEIPLNDVSKKNFVNTKETLSIYQVQEANTNATEQKIYNVFSSEYYEGEVIIKLQKPTPFLIFMQQKELRSTDICRGYIQAVSLTNSAYFNSCYTSSYESKKFDCNAGFSGDNHEKEYSTWKTASNKSLGQYVSINFNYDMDIYSFTFKTLNSTENAITELSLYFPNTKNPETFTISLGHHHYKLKTPIKTKTIKAVISKVNDPKSQSGGNIAFYGIPCIDSKNQQINIEKKNQYEINIFFRSKNVNILTKPLNWLIDSGMKKQVHGNFKYGWEKLPTSIESENLDKKDLSHAGISFLPLECKINEACDTLNTWSIDLLHEGTYYISIEIGSPSGRQELNSIKVNGEVFINNIFLKPKQYTKVSAEVNITKNKIVQISTNTNTVIQSVQLLFLHN
ncbi:LCCL domain-containing protein [Plasmodium malariae]|uniref:LCCL domain-containing protein n=1 Tax=Plasmodium malariae TaxID=5858 RepID=A0A1A8W7D3_PLAMA|nr:LCCL domain-containing protein [Plasmodium malariae]SBS88714.1 PA14 domain containing protein [Plasmodium malariae]SCO94057.1 LCCL domain-containing protein [Plasmodium malariae]